MLPDSPIVLVVQECPGTVAAFSAVDPASRTAIRVGDRPHEIELAPDGRAAYVSNFGLLEANFKDGVPGTSISVVDVAARVERTRYALPGGHFAPHGLKLRPPDYRELFTNTEDGMEAMVVFDAASGQIMRTFSLPPRVHNFLFQPDGSTLFAFTLTGEVCRIDADSGEVTARVPTGSPRGLAWKNEQLIVSGRGEILFVDSERLETVRRFVDLEVGQIFYPAVTPDGAWILAPAVIDGVLLVIDAQSGAVAHRIDTGSPLLAAIDPSGTHAWISNVRIPEGMFGPSTLPRPGGVTRLDLRSFRTEPIEAIDDTNALAIVPSGPNRDR